MAKAWINNLQHLIARNITDKDILLVKLLTVDTYDGIPKITTNIYPAKVIHQNKKIEWHINDYMDDFLIIDVDETSGDLGSTDVDEHLSHILTGCYIIKLPENRGKFHIVDKQTHIVIATAETKREANIIKQSLAFRGKKTLVIQNISKIA